MESHNPLVLGLEIIKGQECVGLLVFLVFPYGKTQKVSPTNDPAPAWAHQNEGDTFYAAFSIAGWFWTYDPVGPSDSKVGES